MFIRKMAADVPVPIRDEDLARVVTDFSIPRREQEEAARIGCFVVMSEPNAAMRTALRVLAAIMDKVEPSPSDVEELKGLAPEDADNRLETLVYKVVQKALAERAKARRTGSD